MALISQTVYFMVLLSSVHSACVSEIYPNTYFQGGDVAMVYTPNADYCQIVCTYHPTCLLFTFLPGDWMTVNSRFQCILKDSDIQTLQKIPAKGVISGHSLKQCTQITACNAEVYEGLDMKGQNYNITNENSYEECQKRCTNENHCQFFTYTSALFHSRSLRNKCYLKYSDTGTPTQIRQLEHVASGFSLKPCRRAETDCRSDIFQNRAFSGVSTGRVLTPDVFACQTTCTYRPNCLFFSFYNSGGDVKNPRYSCLMMTSKTGIPDTFAEKGSVTSGFSLLNCRRAFSACHTGIYRNLVFLGTEVSTEYAKGYKACQQLCTDSIRCQFFTYVSCVKEGQCKCYLRMSTSGSPSNIVPEDGNISGYSLRLCQKVNSMCIQKYENKGRIIGGTNSSAGEWPWQVSLHVKLSTQSHFCGGSIINDQWILTAAHCTEDLLLTDVWRVYSGISKQSEITTNTSFFKVQEIVVHPNYEVSEEGYDIALMKLDRPMNFSGLQHPPCLPSLEIRNADYIECWVTGWGYTKERGKIEDVLQKVKIPLIPNTECQLQYKEHTITKKMMCAGYPEGGRDACKGDSGGPLSCKYQGKWYLVGVTSWGEGCARPGQPGVYTNVAEFIDWIQEKTLKW